jgi:hypothetical protein
MHRLAGRGFPPDGRISPLHLKDSQHTTHRENVAGISMTKKEIVIADKQIEQRIFMIRGQKVMLDRDLAELYGVQTRVLKQAVRRNIRRFPGDFMLS